MNIKRFKILADENIHADVVKYLSFNGFSISSVFEYDLQGKPDIELIHHAFKEDKIILTHDADFGKIVYTSQINFLGIIYLRPGHLNSAFTISSISEFIKQNIELTPPFIVVIENMGSGIRIRIRNNLF